MNIPDNSVSDFEAMQDGLAEADWLYMSGDEIPYALDRPCESCGLAEALEGDIDCLACCVSGELDWIFRERAPRLAALRDRMEAR